MVVIAPLQSLIGLLHRVHVNGSSAISNADFTDSMHPLSFVSEEMHAPSDRTYLHEPAHFVMAHSQRVATNAQKQ